MLYFTNYSYWAIDVVFFFDQQSDVRVCLKMEDGSPIYGSLTVILKMLMNQWIQGMGLNVCGQNWGGEKGTFEF